MSFVALLDANVLYPAYLRGLLRLAQAGVYQPRGARRMLRPLSLPVDISNHRQRSDPEAIFLDHHDASAFECVRYPRQLPQ